MSLGVVNAVDMASQLLMPMVLVRWLSGAEFGEYRLTWLIAGTAMALLPLSIPASLSYFIPRGQPEERGRWYGQAALFMAGAALLGAALVGLFGMRMGLGSASVGLVSVFLGGWVFASLLDVLFSSRLEGTRQAQVNAVFVVLRLVLILAAAFAWRTLEAVLAAHVLLAALKSLATVYVLMKSGARWRLIGSHAHWREQLSYAAPFGLSTGMYLLRGRMDQWLVASRFSAAEFGLYSVAAVFTPVQGLIRSAINSVLLPEMNRLHGNADLPRMLEINNKANVGVALLIFPVLGFVFVAAPPLLQVLFTAEYGAAASVMRVYVILLLIEAVEVTMLMTAHRQGPFMMTLDAIALAFGLTVSAMGASLIGLWGAALGGVAAACLVQGLTFRRCAKLMKTSVANLQPWWTLFRILVAAVAAAAVGRLALDAVLQAGTNSVLSRLSGLFVAAVTLGIAYLIALRLSGLSSVVVNVLGGRMSRYLGFFGREAT